MPVPVLALVVVVASLLVLPFAARAFWVTAVVHRGWTSTSSLILLSGMVGGLPVAVSNLIAPQPEALDAFGNVRVGLTGWAAQLQLVVLAANLVIASVFFVSRVSREPIIAGPWLAIALVVVVASSDVVNGHAAEVGPRCLTLFALLLAASVAQPGRPASLGAAAVGLMYAMLGGLQAALHPTESFRACRADKCGPGGALYTGALTNENGMGLVLALTIPFVWLALRGRGRIILVAYVTAMVALTGSRTAQVTAVAALLALAILRPDSDAPHRGPTTAPVRPLASIIGVVGLACLGAVLPLLTSTGAGAFGDRSFYWRKAIAGVMESPLLGHGGTAWPRLYQISEIPIAASYSPHNQWLDVAYGSGMVGLALFIVLLGHLLLRTPSRISTAAAILIPVLATSTLERPWSFAINDSLTFTLLAAVLSVTNALPLHQPAPLRRLLAAGVRRAGGSDRLS
jgi:hypothetical protein